MRRRYCNRFSALSLNITNQQSSPNYTDQFNSQCHYLLIGCFRITDLRFLSTSCTDKYLKLLQYMKHYKNYCSQQQRLLPYLVKKSSIDEYFAKFGTPVVFPEPLGPIPHFKSELSTHRRFNFAPPTPRRRSARLIQRFSVRI